MKWGKTVLVNSLSHASRAAIQGDHKDRRAVTQ
jgi:hypothetical protein